MDNLFTISLKIRKINNGFIVTGAVHRDGGESHFPEDYYPDLEALDMAISERLADAERRAGEIEPVKSAAMGWLTWGPPSSARDGDDDE